jgi:Bacterial Ig domain
MKHIQVLLALAAIGLAGCRAQEGTPRVAQPGLPPTAIADVAVVALNSANNSIAALANDVDQSGTGLTITTVQVDQTVPPMAGTVVTTDGATITFTPPAAFVGVVTLTYAIADGTGATSSAVIAVSVLPVAPPPVALPDAATVVQDSGATDIDVLANDVDLAAGGLTVSGFTVTTSLPAAAHAIAIVGNQVRFTPAAGFIGAVVVSYTITDVNGATADGVLTVVVSPIAVPTGPVPVPDARVVAQDSGATDVDVLANDVDPAGGGLTLTGVVVTTSVPNAVHAVAMVGNQVRFTPAAGFVGSVVVTYTATDTNGDAADGVLTVVVSPLALPLGPVPVPDAKTVAQDSGATDIDVLANDIDIVGGGLTVTNVVVTAAAPNVAQTVAIVGNQVRFTPAGGFAGAVVITYTATDDDGNAADGVLNVIVTPPVPNVGLVAIPDAKTLAQDAGATDIDVLANDIDFAGGGLTLSNAVVFSSLPAAAHAVSVVGNQVRFTPVAGFAGVVVVNYTATDINGLTSNGVLNITVTPAALQLDPVALPDSGTPSSSGGVQSFDVLANDLDPAGGGLTLSNLVVNAVPANPGAFAVVGNQVQYTPAALYTGVVTVTYTATDINGNTSDGTLTLLVVP